MRSVDAETRVLGYFPAGDAHQDSGAPKALSSLEAKGLDKRHGVYLPWRIADILCPHVLRCRWLETPDEVPRGTVPIAPPCLPMGPPCCEYLHCITLL